MYLVCSLISSNESLFNFEQLSIITKYKGTMHIIKGKIHFHG